MKAALAHPGGVGKSDSAIAKHVGVDHVTVANWREKMTVSCEIHKIESRTVTRGKSTYQQNTVNIGVTTKQLVVSGQRLLPASATLTKSQQSTIGAEAQPLFAKEAKERQREHGGTAPGKGKQTLPKVSTEVIPSDLHNDSKGDSRDIAAKAVGVSGYMVGRAANFAAQS